LAQAFRTLAKLLKRENTFKSAAFTKVADILEDFPSKITSSKDVESIKGIGKSSCAKIDEFLTTGKLAALEELGGGGGPPPQQSREAQMAMKFLS